MRRGTPAGAKGTGTSVKPENMLGQNVAILDPFMTVEGPARKYRVSYDPMLDIEKGEDNEAGQIMAIAEAVVVPEEGSSSHFTESVETILAGMIEAVIHTEKDRANHNLVFLRSKVLEGFEELKKYLADAPSTDAGLSDDAFSVVESVGDDEGGSFNSTLSRQIRWIADPRVQRHLGDGGFSLAQAVRENWSVYICVPPSRIPRMKRWLRAIVRIALDAKMDSSLKHDGPRTLFLLDEFSALGHMQLIEDSAAYMAGYSIKLVPVIQNIGQVKKLYDKNWETFLGNSGGIIAWGLNDLETEKYISDRMGPRMDWELTYGESRSKSPEDITATNKTQSENLAQKERAIRWPNEIHNEGARKQLRAFVISADGSSFMVERVAYMDGDGQGLFDSPEFITKWEGQLTKADRDLLNSQ